MPLTFCLSLSVRLMRDFYDRYKFLLNEKTVVGAVYSVWPAEPPERGKKNRICSVLGMSRWARGKEGAPWLIFMSPSTPAYINQSQPPSCKGVGAGKRCGRREIVRSTARRREMCCCHFKGLWTGHHAFCSAITGAQEPKQLYIRAPVNACKCSASRLSILRHLLLRYKWTICLHYVMQNASTVHSRCRHVY